MKSLILLTLLVLSSSILFGAIDYRYHTTYDSDGVPTGTKFTAGDGTVPTELDNAITHLNEGVAADLSNTNVFMLNYTPTGLTKEGDVWITYIHEDAGWENSLGFYTYTGDEPTLAELENKDTILFPTVDATKLTKGDRISLGSFASGTKFGWFVVGDGWDLTDDVDDDNDDLVFEIANGTVYSTSSFNPNNNIQCVYLNAHYDPDPEKESHILLGFEDTPLDAASCDNDYNDVIFYISTKVDYSLPVELTSFTGKLNGGAAKLSWTTGSEIDNRGFILERKENDGNWIAIASYLNTYSLVGAGNTSEQTEYTFVDTEIKPGNIYSYRLADVSETGETTVHEDDMVTIEYMDKLVNAEQFTISNVYPNPFNPSTNIEFSIPEKQDVKINVFDMRGKMVSELYNGSKSAGNHRITWDASEFPSGIYFVHLSNGQKLSIQKCIFLK